MEDVIYDMDNFKKLHNKRPLKENLKEKINNAFEWVKDNKETVCILVPSMFGAVTATVKVVGKHANLKKEENNKNLYCYDRSLGHYWKLRRELTNDEWVSIDKRKQNGERLGDILDELKVLK